ncbi:MAG: thrombospondin type 3 repeat-containing protein [Candidatus Tectomicrobia bacterium]|nr:thrombospondin type 3 repeat-containing protein [Candidatus Tectomicrobia bacterium]
MFKYLMGLTLLALLTVVSLSAAKTPDGVTPAEESVCDGLPRTLWGLCVSYCEAMDCHLVSPHASLRACQQVADNYAMKAERLDYSPLPLCVDRDQDGVDDLLDNCREVYNPEQEDTDGNGLGNVCEETEEPPDEEPPTEEPPTEDEEPLPQEPPTS